MLGEQEAQVECHLRLVATVLEYDRVVKVARLDVTWNIEVSYLYIRLLLNYGPAIISDVDRIAKPLQGALVDLEPYLV